MQALAVSAVASLSVLVVLAALVGFIAHAVIKRASPQDLPQVLAGLSTVIIALSSLLPWRVDRPDRSVDTPGDPPIVSGLVIPQSIAAPGEETR